MRTALLLALLAALPVSAAEPYHLELEAHPSAAFPYLGRFGTVEIHVYAGGVRAEALVVNGFSRNGAEDVTVMNPLQRTYFEVPVTEIAPALRKLAGATGATELAAIPVLGPTLRGKVKGIDATRYRIVFGPKAWIDLWTTSAVPQNPQFRSIVAALVEGVSPGTAGVVEKIPGTPVYVELNFRRFKKVPLVTLKKLDRKVSPAEEKAALELGKLYIPTGMLEKLFD